MKACVFTLGCKLNEVESASVMRGLEQRGYETTSELGPADLYLLNTCAVTAEAEKKSRQAVARMRRYNPAAPVFVFGCAAGHDAAAFRAREGVTFVAGAMKKDAVLAAVDGVLHGICVESETAFCELPAPKQTKTRAYLRVQDGCNRFCSYCLIPYLRGRSRSRSMESVRQEAEACGAKEIVLTGVDLSSYRDGENGLGELVASLAGLPARIRLGSLEVSCVTEDFLRKLRAAGNVCAHFHLSLQSGSDAVLAKMNRRYTRAQYLEACRKIYAVFPEASITTDIIAGFPTETEEDFRASLSIIGEAGFLRVHAFPFAAREGAAAAKLDDLPAEVKKERVRMLIAAGKQSGREFVARFLGTTMTALFEADGGYTENYIRVSCPEGREGALERVRLTKPTAQGAACEILR